jgi:murein DD-endopeptidase MepM/ murein hydrolase activator NlpD
MVRSRSRSRKKSDQRSLAGLSLSGTRATYGSVGKRASLSVKGPARRGGALVLFVLGALVLVNLYVFVWDKKTSVSAIKEQAEHATPALAIPAHSLETFAPGSGGPTTLLPAAPAPARAMMATGSGGAATAPIAPPGTVEGKVGKSDTLGRLLKHSGLSGAEADEIIRALSGVLDFKSIRAGQQFRIERAPDGRVRSFELVVSKLQTVRAERDDKGVMVGKSTMQQTKTEIRAIGGRIDSSLYAAIKAAGENGALVDVFVDAFAYDLDFFNDTHDGDTFRAVVEREVKEDGSFLRYKRVLAAQYVGKAGSFATYEHDGKFFDGDGASAEKTFLKTPLKYSRVSSGFDRKRMHPVLHEVRAHLGIDYAAPVGTPVWAAADGVISFRGDGGGAGNLVMIKHDGGIETAYMHLSKFADGQAVGGKVAAKTVIGYVGQTGLATGPHLHFGVKKNGEYIDPTQLAPVRGKSVPGPELDAYRAEVAGLDAKMAAIVIAPPKS